jgi:predicted transposase/invertase (TIGR01784 family)
MQMGWSAAFKQRLQFGTTKAYVDQLQKGEDYNYLQPVYGLGLIGEIFNPESDEWYHHYKVVNIKDSDDQIKGLQLIFVELPKFKPNTFWEKKLGALWLRFLNEISTMDDIPAELSDVPEISKAIEITQEATFTKDELAEYNGYWDQVSIEKTIKSDAKREGVEMGMEMGMEMGKAEGIAEGLEMGKAEGELKAKREMARNLMQLNVADSVIQTATGLTLSELETLRATLKA